MLDFCISSWLYFWYFQAYLTFFHTAEVDWGGDGNVGLFLYNAGDGIISYNPARAVLGRRRSLDDEVISKHPHTFKILSCGPIVFFADGSDPMLAALSPDEQVRKPKLVKVRMILRKDGM